MTDFEAEDAKEWQETTDQPRRRRRIIPTLPFEPDNAAGTAWRQNEAPIAHFLLPKDFAGDEKRLQARHRGRKLIPEESMALFPELEQIEMQTETKITPGRDQGPDGLMVQIWGHPENAEEARRLIKEWVEMYQPAKQKQKNWAKIYSITPEHRPRYEAKLNEEAYREQFRRAPPLGIVFPATALFDWPMDYDHPSHVAGKNLEAYDQIRTELFCYIGLDSHQRAIRITGDSFQNVKKALKRVRISLFQTVAKKRPPRTLYLITPLVGQALRSEVRLSPYQTSQHLESKKSGPPSVTPRLCGSQMQGEGRVRRENEADGKFDSNAHMMSSAVTTTLATLRHYRGCVRMRAVLGVFALTTYKKQDTLSLDDFEIMMQDHQVKGLVANDISLDQSILKHVSTADGFLSPVDTFDNVMSVKPAFDAAFICSSGPALYRLDAAYTQQVNGEIVCASKTWSKLSHIEVGDSHNGLSDWTKEPENKILDINMINLEHSYAWRFKASVSEPINDAKMPALAEFAEAVVIKVPSTEKPYQEVDGPYLRYKPVPGLILQAMQERQSWTYNIKSSPYLCEVAKVQEFRIRDGTSAKPNQNLLTPTMPHWTVSVFRREWDVWFANNASLATGESVAWDLDVQKMFPGGTEQFLEDLAQTRQVILGEWRGDDLLGSVSGSSPSVRFTSSSSGPKSGASRIPELGH